MSPKEFMPVDDIKDKILSNYPYKIYDIYPVKFKDTDKQRAVYRFETDSGPKCLKKVYFDEPNLLFVYSVIEWLYRHGINSPRFLPSNTGKRYFNYKNNLFIVTDWIEGRKCDYDNDSDVCASAFNLGKIHKASYNFRPIEGSFERKNDLDWYKTYSKRFLQLLQFNNSAYNIHDKFSKIYLSSFDYFSKRAQHAVSVLGSIENKELSLLVVKYNTICHLDYVNKNLIFTDTGELYVIDFDKCEIDIPIHDIGTFLKRILKRKKTCWNYSILMAALTSYEKARELSISEYLGLYSYLEFPQKYWKISRDYFNNRKNCNRNTFISMLNEACEQKEDHDIFCSKFADYIEDRFKIKMP